MAEIQTELPGIFSVHMGMELDGATEWKIPRTSEPQVGSRDISPIFHSTRVLGDGYNDMMWISKRLNYPGMSRLSHIIRGVCDMPVSIHLQLVPNSLDVIIHITYSDRSETFKRFR
jgi:hypothetical protein